MNIDEAIDYISKINNKALAGSASFLPESCDYLKMVKVSFSEGKYILFTIDKYNGHVQQITNVLAQFLFMPAGSKVIDETGIEYILQNVIGNGTVTITEYSIEGIPKYDEKTEKFNWKRIIFNNRTGEIK